MFVTHAPTTVTYTLSLHDALPISSTARCAAADEAMAAPTCASIGAGLGGRGGSTISGRSEEHTSELQSRENLVCRLLLEKKKAQRRARHRLAANDHRDRDSHRDTR